MSGLAVLSHAGDKRLGRGLFHLLEFSIFEGDHFTTASERERRESGRGEGGWWVAMPYIDAAPCAANSVMMAWPTGCAAPVTTQTKPYWQGGFKSAPHGHPRVLPREPATHQLAICPVGTKVLGRVHGSAVW